MLGTTERVSGSISGCRNRLDSTRPSAPASSSHHFGLLDRVLHRIRTCASGQGRTPGMVGTGGKPSAGGSSLASLDRGCNFEHLTRMLRRTAAARATKQLGPVGGPPQIGSPRRARLKSWPDHPS
jgi:hypothetical protein